MSERFTILGGKVHIYRRPNSSSWQCASFLAGKNRRTTTKEDSLSKAKEVAEDWYLQLRGKFQEAPYSQRTGPDNYWYVRVSISASSTSSRRDSAAQRMRVDNLEEEKLQVDREGNPRTAYSLRHTYICLRLLEGADIYQIAKNCRTSVEMIEKYYASHLKTQLNASAINVMRPRPKKAVSKKGPRRVEDQPLADAM